MQIPDLDDLIVDLINRAEHPEIVNADTIRDKTWVYTKPAPEEAPSRVSVRFASGSNATILVHHIEGPGMAKYGKGQWSEMPPEVR